jgi:hypothetical protein
MFDRSTHLLKTIDAFDKAEKSDDYHVEHAAAKEMREAAHAFLMEQAGRSIRVADLVNQMDEIDYIEDYDPEYGRLMLLDDFIIAVRKSIFYDFDGFGLLACLKDGKIMVAKRPQIMPSAIDDFVRSDATHIVWHPNQSLFQKAA